MMTRHFYFFTVLILVLLAVSTNGDESSKDTCDRHDVDGCSVPLHLPFVFKQKFTPACNRHDICYSCGKDCQVSRQECDQIFLHNMEAACEESFVVEVKSKNGDATCAEKYLQDDKARQEVFARRDSLLDDKVVPLLKTSKSVDVQEAVQVPQSVTNSILQALALELSDVLKRFPSGVCDDLVKELDELDELDVSNTDSPVANVLGCYYFAGVYHRTVRVFGESHYLDVSPSWCCESFVLECVNSGDCKKAPTK